MIRSRFLAGVCVIVGCTINVAYAGEYSNDFEIDDFCWDTVTRVASGGGTVGAPSASGGWHAETTPSAFTRWGGYGDGDTCESASASLLFPEEGYTTSVAIYLDVDGDYANDSRKDYSSAINNEVGSHRRDFIISCGFYNDDRADVGLGTGDRFICNVSNNAPGWPTNPARDPAVVATTSGWYTFKHDFYDDGSGVLAVDMSIVDSAGAVIKSWTLSTPSDVINSTVGGNRYGWFVNQGWGTLAIDDAYRSGIEPYDTAPIPTLSQSSLIVLTLLLMLGGFIGFRRRV